MTKEEILSLYNDIKNEKVDISKLDDKTAEIMCKLMYEEICLLDKRIKEIQSSKK